MYSEVRHKYCIVHRYEYQMREISIEQVNRKYQLNFNYRNVNSIIGFV